MSRCIAHLDMDAFFASVELLRRPELRGKPVVVASNRQRSVVAAASYAARRYGIHSAQPLVTARRRCPELITVPADMALYRRISAQVMEILRRYSDLVEAAGLDEAYLDLSDSRTPRTRARALKTEVRRETGLIASIGLGPNKLVAKIASDLDKPDGFAQLSQADFLPTIGDRSARLIPGVGPKTMERLGERLGINTIAELAEADPARLREEFGSHGDELAGRARGIDDRPVEIDRVRKSESRERTFGEDIRSREHLEQTLRDLAAEVAGGLAAQGLAGRTVTLKLRLAPFRTHTRSRTLAEAINDPQRLAQVAIALLHDFGPLDPVRLIGVGLSSLEAQADGGEDRQPRELRLPI